MSEYTIEQAGVHYASHALLDARRALAREMRKDEAAMSLIKRSDDDDDNGGSSNSHRKGEGRTAAAPDDEATTLSSAAAAAAYADTLRSRTPVTRVTDRLDDLGRHAPSSYTKRNPGASQPSYASSLAAAAAATVTAAAADGRTAQLSTHMQYEYERTLAMLQRHRRECEAVAALETFERNAIADLWALAWEELFAAAAQAGYRAAQDTRARVARAHWHARVAQRRSELRATLREGCTDAATTDGVLTTTTRSRQSEEPLLHTPELLQLLDAEYKRSLWPAQLPSIAPLS